MSRMDLEDKILECDQTSMDQETNNMKPLIENEHLGTSRTDISEDKIYNGTNILQKGSWIKEPKRWALAMCLFNCTAATHCYNNPRKGRTFYVLNFVSHKIEISRESLAETREVKLPDWLQGPQGAIRQIHCLGRRPLVIGVNILWHLDLKVGD